MNYQIWLIINLNHAYFFGNRNGIDLQPTVETALFLKRMGVLWRKRDNVSWMLLVEKDLLDEKFAIWTTEKPLCFEFSLKLMSPELEYVTDWREREGEHWAIVCKKVIMNEWLLKIIPPLNESEKVINVTVDNKILCWEFILIPKSADFDIKIQLREAFDRIIFTDVEKRDFPGEGMVFRCQTTEPLPILEKYDYRICLWEQRESGEVLLSSNIPIPKSNARSVIEPHEKICTYFYF